MSSFTYDLRIEFRPRWLLAFATGVVVVVTGSISLPSATAAPISTGKIVSENSGKCLADTRIDVGQQHNVATVECADREDQAWLLSDDEQRWDITADTWIVGAADWPSELGAISSKTTGDGVTHDSENPTAPGSPRVSNLTCDTANLSWDASTDNTDLHAYDIFGDGQFLISVPGDTLNTQLRVLPGVNWELHISAKDAAGNTSDASDTVEISPPKCSKDSTKPTAPSDLDGTASGTWVALNWTASSDDVAVTAYDIYRDGERVGTTQSTTDDGTGTAYTDTGLDAEESYEYVVRSRDAVGNQSGPSRVVDITTNAQCTKPVCKVQEIATDLDLPWGLTTVPDGSVLYTRRDASDIIRLDPSTGAQRSIGTVPKVEGTDGAGGLMGLALSPNFDQDNWLYVMHSSPTDNRIVRIKYTDGRLQSQSAEVLLSSIERGRFHNGGRLRFGPDGMLYATTGDAETGKLAQDTSSLNGKILRLEPNGDVPPGNPFDNYVWSYGHRNPQGLAFDSQGRLWGQEFGGRIADETNLIRKGGNYGWPACAGTSGDCGGADLIAPKQIYGTAEGACSGIAILKDTLFVACLRGATLYRFDIEGTELTRQESHVDGSHGRLRTVEPTSDGDLWLTTSTTGDKDNVAENSNERILRVDLADDA